MFEIKLPVFDLGLIGLYFIIVISVGLWQRRRSARNLESYFLGGKVIPWWMLALSGSVSNFDITGTMWIVSLLFLFGTRSFWIFAMFAFFHGAFLMSFMARWIRRTNVMTAAELIKVRFGVGSAGRTARMAAAILVIIFQVFAVGYAFQGIGKFAATYLPFTPLQCASGIMAITTLYVVIGGFTSVVLTDVIQAAILNIGGLIVAIIAFMKIDLAVLHQKFTTSILPVWHIPEMAGTDYAGYEFFGIMCLVWLSSGVLISLGGAGGTYGEQRFLATRNPQDAAKAGAGWSLFLVVRWALVAGITYLAISTLTGVTDPERVLPVVLKDYLPTGLRGFVLAGLIAAFMSTFSSVLNSAASILVRDLIQPKLPKMNEKQLIRLSYLATVLIVVLGLAAGVNARSIDRIWVWLVIGLGASTLLPNVLRWYWWRMNGWGYAIGTFAGLICSMVVLFNPDTPEYIYGPAINIVALLGSVLGSIFTAPVDKETMVAFYREIRPKGFWNPVKQQAGLSELELNQGLDRSSVIVINTLLGLIAITGFNLSVIYLVGHWFFYAGVAFGLAGGASVGLYFSWYKRLGDMVERCDKTGKR